MKATRFVLTAGCVSILVSVTSGPPSVRTVGGIAKSVAATSRRQAWRVIAHHLSTNKERPPTRLRASKEYAQLRRMVNRVYSACPQKELPCIASADCLCL